MIVFFAVTTIICAVGWASTRISLVTVLWYMSEKEYPFPSGEDMKKGTEYAVKHFLKK